MQHSVVIHLRICALLALCTIFPVPTIAAPSLRPITVGTQKVTDDSYLRTVLPQSTYAYMRIPNLWGVLGSPSGNIFTKLLQSAAHQEAIKTIRGGVLAKFLPDIPKEWQGLVKFLLAQTRSPLELAIIAGAPKANGEANFPELLLTVTLEQMNVAAVNSMLGSLVTKTQALALLTPLQADGNGKLLVAGVPVDMYFDVAKHRLFLGAALLNNLALPLQQRIAKLQPTVDHPMYRVEKGIDANGQGLLLWIDPAMLLKIAEDLGKIGEVAILRAFGLAEARSVSVGMGASGGKQRFKMAIEMPQVGLRSVFPGIHTDIPFVSAAGLDTVFMFGLPTTADLAKLEASADPFMSTENHLEYANLKASVKKLLGLTPEQLLSTFKGEMLVLHDKAGYYLTLGLSDPANYTTMLKYLIQTYKLKYETRELLGTTFHHLALPSLADIAQPAASAPQTTPTDPIQAPGLLELMFRQPTHLYWIERNGYLIFADIPQVLMDILYSTPGTDVATWLRGPQGIEPGGALFLASTRAAGIPQLLYQVHVWLLAYLGDITGHPVDLFAMPSVRELNLPDDGAYSVQFASSPDQLAMELVYESSPLEGTLTIMGGMATLTTMGIVAAVTIPSFYANFADDEVVSNPTIVAGITLEKLIAVRDQVTDFYAANGRFPNIQDMSSFAIDRTDITNAEFTLTPDTGVITIKFTEVPTGDGNELILAPVINNLRWECSGTLSDELRPEGLCQP